MTQPANVIVTYFDRTSGEPLHLTVIVGEDHYVVTLPGALDGRGGRTARTHVWKRFAKRYGYGHRTVRKTTSEGARVAKLATDYVADWRAAH